MDGNDVTIFAAAVGAIASLIGGLVSGWLTIKASDRAHVHATKTAELRRKQAILGYLNAIRSEMDALWAEYSYKISPEIVGVAGGSALTVYFPIQQEYFPIYKANSGMIVEVDSDDLRRQIIATYTRANGMIDSLRMNNYLLGEFDKAAHLARETGQPNHQERAHILWGHLVEYAGKLKVSDGALREDVAQLSRLLEAAGAKKQTFHARHRSARPNDRVKRQVGEWCGRSGASRGPRAGA